MSVRMRPRGSSPCTPPAFTGYIPVATVNSVRRGGFEGSPGNGADHGHHAVPHRWVPGVGRSGPERDRRTGRVDVLPPAGVREAKLLRGGGNAVGGAVAGELGQELVVLGGEPSLFLLQRRDLVAGLGGGGRLRHKQQGRSDQRHGGDERRDRRPAATPARARRGKRARRRGRVGPAGPPYSAVARRAG